MLSKWENVLTQLVTKVSGLWMFEEIVGEGDEDVELEFVDLFELDLGCCVLAFLGCV